MSKLNHIFKKLIDPKYHALVEADYVSADGQITSDGERALMQELFFVHQDALAKRAQERIEARAKAAKN